MPKPEMSELIPWPLELGGYPTESDMREYERARAEAAIARLRLAVEALNMIATEDDPTAIEALRQIGPLP